MQSFPQK